MYKRQTIGLAHHNAGMAEHLKQNWIFELMRRAKGLGAKGLGFSFWAIPEAAMQQPDEYKKREGQIIRIMQETAAYARQLGGFEVSFEQMYVPYQPPFTIGQTERYLQRVYEANGNPAYVCRLYTSGATWSWLLKLLGAASYALARWPF